MPRLLRNSRYLSRLLCGALLVGATIASVDATAGPQDRDRTQRWGFGLEGGLQKLVEGEWDYSTVEQYGGVRLSRGLSSQWTLTAAIRYGYVRPGAEFEGEEVGFSGASGAPLYTVLYQPALTVRHRFSPTARVTPTVGFGLGLTKWHVIDKTGESVDWFPSGEAISGFDTDGNAVDLEGSNLTLLFELGLNIGLTGALDLDLGARYEILSGNDRDNIGLSSYWGPEQVDANTGLVGAFVSLTWWFGSGDRDGDGVPNDRDGCPDEAEDRDGFNDTDGCPDPDNDQDGIPDELDACPTRAEDLDGFQDEDGCPDPDNDGDGIFDGRDGCPDEAEDIDGWEDSDGCPDPDNDQDGVPDTEDQCPRTAPDSKVDANGCAIVVPVAKAPVVFVPAAGGGEVLEGVSFVSGSAELTPTSITRLVELAATLQANPDLKIEIAGHTDATGGAEANRALSGRRAESVRRSLIQMGVAAGRLTAVGYGEDYPIADNGTAEGRARNRRVEIHRQ